MTVSPKPKPREIPEVLTGDEHNSEQNEPEGQTNIATARQIETDVLVADGQTKVVAAEALKTSKPPRKCPDPKSKVWDLFIKFKDESGEQKGRCRLYGHVLSVDPKKHGTSSVLAHQKQCPNKMVGNKSQTELHFGHGVSMWKFNQETARKALGKMIIMDELPFRVVEAKGFKQYTSAICPRFKVPSRWTVARDCYEIYVEEKEKLSQNLKTVNSIVSLTTDCWTSIQKINYMCLTAHYIDSEWKLHKRVLNFCPNYKS